MDPPVLDWLLCRNLAECNIRVVEDKLDELFAIFFYSRHSGRLVVREGLTHEERISVILHCVGHAILEHIDQEAGTHFEVVDRMKLDPAELAREPAVDDWVDGQLRNLSFRELSRPVLGMA